VSCAALLLGVALSTVACGARNPSQLTEIGAGLRGPRGLEASVYARGLKHVSAFAFDARGRLWATTSGANTHSSDGVYLVARAHARPVRVADGLVAPLGLVWVGRRLFVSSLGRVTAFGGLRGARFATRATVLKGPVARGENNNLIRAGDGRLVMGVSSSCDHCVPRSPWSATIVSFRTNGSGLRVVARGVRAAFGLAYRPGTRDLFATMNERDDLGARTPDDRLGLIRPGQDWKFPHCYGQGGAACKGAPTAVATLDRHAAAGGVAFLAGSALVAEWQLGKVLRVTLERTGTAYRGVATTFLTGIANPLPVAATAHGAVLVGDWATGTIYRIAAP
jgi:glucose/arabinose dehydrogenase